MAYKMIQVLESPLSEIEYKGLDQIRQDIIHRYNPKDVFDMMYLITTDKEDLKINLHDKCVIYYLPQLPDPFHFFNMFIDAIKIARIAKQNDVDLIFSRGVFFNAVKGVLAGKIGGIRTAVSVLGAYRRTQQDRGSYNMRFEWLSNFTEKFVLHFADHVLVYGDSLVNYLLDLGIDQNKIMIENIGADENVFYPTDKSESIKNELNLTDELIVLNVGRLSKEKLVNYLVDCIPFVLEDVPNAKFIFVGDGPAKSELIEQCTRLGVQGNVIFCGAKPANELVKYYNFADIMFFGQGGFAIIESALCSKPAIAFDYDRANHIIKHGYNGYITELNPMAMSKFIISLLKNNELRETLGKNARDEALTKYTTDVNDFKKAKMFIDILTKK